MSQQVSPTTPDVEPESKVGAAAGSASGVAAAKALQLKPSVWQELKDKGLAVPKSPADCTPAWVTKMFQNSYQKILPADGSVTVSNVRPEDMMVTVLDGSQKKDGGGISGSNLVKLHLTYSPSKPAGAPDTVVFKFTDMRGKVGAGAATSPTSNTHCTAARRHR